MSNQPNKYAGSTPDAYQDYLVPILFDCYAEDLANRIQVSSGAAVLETACGTGVLTKYLSDRLHRDCRIVATDINPAMLDVAKKKLKRSGRIEFQVANGIDLPFPDGSFDAVVCQFGVMFFPDISLGYREAARVLKPGGQLVFSVWSSLDKNGFSKSVHKAAMSLDRDDPPTFLRSPYVYNNVADIRAELDAAGFSTIEATTVKKTSTAKSPRHLAIALAEGSPLAAQLAERQLSGSAIELIEEALISEYGDKEISAPMQAIVISASRSH